MKMKNVQIGKGSRIDKTAVLGYKGGRNIKAQKTIIGKNATVRSNTIIYSNTEIGDGLETGHCVTIREQNKIGDKLNIWNNSTIDYGCVIGNNVKIHCNVYVAQFTTIEDDVFLAPGVMIANDPHPICTKCMKGPTIKKGARVGVNATIMPHIAIGRNSLIAAGSVVTKDVPDNSVVCGVPAKVTGNIQELKCKADIKDRAYGRGR